MLKIVEIVEPATVVRHGGASIFNIGFFLLLWFSDFIHILFAIKKIPPPEIFLLPQ
jgi:hypothetical protein